MFEHLTPRLPVADLARTLAFYRDRLGFRVSVLWPDRTEPTFAILERDSVSVGFNHRDGPDDPQDRNAELYIRVRDAAGLHAALRDELPIEWGPEVYTYGRREFAICDPDGYLVIFTEPTDDPPTIDEPG